jgi:hypothetical protein
VLVVALLVGWILELLQRRDDASVPDAAPDLADGDTVALTDANAVIIGSGTVEVDPDATDTSVLVDAGSADAPADTAVAPAAAAKKNPQR